MSFQLTEYGALSTMTLCSFKESPTGLYERVVGQSFSVCFTRVLFLYVLLMLTYVVLYSHLSSLYSY